MPWFHFSFDMLILKSPRSSNHLRLINLSICIHTCDLSYPGATLPVLIAHLQGSTLCDCTGSERLGGSPVACKDKRGGAPHRPTKEKAQWITVPGGSRNRTWSPRLHFPRFKSCSAISSNGSLLPPRLSFVFESRRATMDYYLCTQVLLKRPICEQWPFPRCPNIKIAPQLLFAEPVTVRRAAAEPASCPGARSAGHRPPLTAPPAPPRPPRAPLPTDRATCPGGPARLWIPPCSSLPPGPAEVPKLAGILSSRSSLSGQESRMEGQSYPRSPIAQEFQEQIFMWTLFERRHLQICLPCKI